ncbi:hypothetical protein [Dyadobacter sp. CY323]|uniref:hypothetical protein n=1 Tax=Dyadobacter sp. CY323 TaxID=2907302 RepID=UPI001F1EFF88|nr:hypothetical protein [Dyadobacter sp. CY323]MCE6987621.1 hypothetical protein [Dyadobacter sp. CY323]
MKKLLFILIAITTFGLKFVNAQNIPSTAGPTNCNCLPQGWEYGVGSGSYTSNRTYYGANTLNQSIAFTPMLPPLPSGANTFISLHGGSVGAVVAGLVPGKKYKFNYSVISAKTDYNVNGEDHSAYFSSTVNFTIRHGKVGQNLTTHIINFDKITEEGIWKTSAFEFTPVGSTVYVTFEDLGGLKPGFVGLDLNVNAIEQCNAGVTQVPLSKSNVEILCPATTANLVLETFGGLIPSGVSLKYFTTPDRTTLPLTATEVGPGTYYAFYYDEANNCYNTKYSTAKIDVTYKPCADITPTIGIDGLNFGGATTRDFVVNLFENNGSPTNGNVSFRITKPSGFTISYPTISGTSMVSGGKQNENSNWTFVENGIFITASSTVPIPAKGKAVIGFNVKRKPTAQKGLTQSLTSTILSGAGGEQNSKNNSIATSVSAN